MTDLTETANVRRSYWPKGLAAKIITGLTGILAVLVAVKATAYSPSETPIFAHQDHFVRLLAFAALTVWTTFTIGLSRRGAAAVSVLAFASFLELVIVPARGDQMYTLASANLGIVFAYCSIHLYWLGLVQRRLRK